VIGGGAGRITVIPFALFSSARKLAKYSAGGHKRNAGRKGLWQGGYAFGVGISGACARLDRGVSGPLGAAGLRMTISIMRRKLGINA